MSSPPAQPRVFISYVREDSAAVGELAAALRRAGLDVWLDRTSLRPGDRWKDRIRTAIEDGDYFVACFSPAYAARDRTYMNEELLVAVEQLRQRSRARRWFIPVLLEPCEVPDYPIGPGETLASLHTLDLSDGSSAGLEILASVLLDTAPPPSGRPGALEDSSAQRSGTATMTVPAAIGSVTVKKAPIWHLDPDAGLIALHRFLRRRVEVLEIDTGAVVAALAVPLTATVALGPGGGKIGVGSRRTLSTRDIGGAGHTASTGTGPGGRSGVHQAGGYVVTDLRFDSTGYYLAAQREHEEGRSPLSRTYRTVYVVTTDSAGLALTVPDARLAHFGRGGRSLITTEGRVSTVWSVSDQRRVASLAHGGTARSWTAADDMGRVLAVQPDRLLVWDRGSDALQPHASYTLREDALLGMSDLTVVRTDRAGRIVCAASRTTLVVLDLDRGELVLRRSPGRPIGPVGVSPDGRYVSAASSDTVEVWDARDHRWLYRLPHAGTVVDLAHRRNELVTLSASGPGLTDIRRWPL